MILLHLVATLYPALTLHGGEPCDVGPLLRVDRECRLLLLCPMNNRKLCTSDAFVTILRPGWPVQVVMLPIGCILVSTVLHSFATRRGIGALL